MTATAPAPWTLEDVPDWPVIRIVLSHDPATGQPLLTVAGEPVEVPLGHDPRRIGIQTAAAEAQKLGRPVRALATDSDQEWPLIVHPDGRTTDPDAMPRRAPRRGREPRWRMPAGLGLGIGGLILLIGLATSSLLIKPTATHTPAAPVSPAPSQRPSPAPGPAPGPPSSPPPAATSASAPASSSTTPEPTISFTTPPSPSTPNSSAPLPQPRRAPQTTPSPTAPRTVVVVPDKPRPPATVTVTATPAPPAQQPPHGPVRIGQITLGTGYCLAIGDDGWIHAELCVMGGDPQDWYYDDARIGRAGNTCLTLDGQGVNLVTCDNSSSQRWTRTDQDQLRHEDSGLCLTNDSDARGSVPLAVVRCST